MNHLSLSCGLNGSGDKFEDINLCPNNISNCVYIYDFKLGLH